MRGRTNVVAHKTNNNTDYTKSTRLDYDSYEYTKNSDGCYDISWDYTIPSTTNYIFAHTVLPCCTLNDGVISVLIDDTDVTNDIVVISENSHDVSIYAINKTDVLGYRNDKMFCLRKQDLKAFGVYGEEFTLTIKFENLYCSLTNIESMSKYYYKEIYVHGEGGDESDDVDTYVFSTDLSPTSKQEGATNYYDVTYTIPSNVEDIMIRTEFGTNIGNMVSNANLAINGVSVSLADITAPMTTEISGYTIDDTLYGYLFDGIYICKQLLKHLGVYGQEFTLTISLYKDSVASIDTINPTVYLFTKDKSVSFDVYLRGSGSIWHGYGDAGTYFYVDSSLYSHIKIEGNFSYGSSATTYTSYSSMTFKNYNDNDVIISKSSKSAKPTTEVVVYERDIIQTPSESTYPTYLRVGYTEGYAEDNKITYVRYAESSFEGTITLTRR